MSTQEERIDALERDVAQMKRDIIYKLDDTNSAVTIIEGISIATRQDVRAIANRLTLLEQNVSKGFELVAQRFEAQDKKLDQILALLASK
jgi:polyhydroxyalkanoate synthesis regulator phasin